ncbi:uncharacterized protein LOC135125644 [Zophobas morio]|uniref:uncharacterized protein LOC135125644 n=1 Tax=Zophobas morio TaxID=2755281 RepID=UPI00308279E9
MFHILIVAVFVNLSFANFIEYDVNKDNVLIEPYVFEDLINSTIEGVRPDIPEPLEIETLDLTFVDEEGAILNGNATLSNLNMHGLQGFQIPSLSFEIIGMMLNLTLVFPEIDLFTDYRADLLVAGSPLLIFGTGNSSVNFGDVVIDVSAQVNLTGGISVENLNMQIYVGNGTFELHGLYDNEDFSELIETVLNEMVVDLIDSNQELISQVLSPTVESLINEILKNAFQTTTTSTTTVTVPL